MAESALMLMACRPFEVRASATTCWHRSVGAYQNLILPGIHCLLLEIDIFWYVADQLYQNMTRTHAFWGYPLCPMITHTVEQVISKSKQDKIKVTNLNNLSKLQIIEFEFKKKSTGDTPLKLLDKMCKYEMEPVSIVENAERNKTTKQTRVILILLMTRCLISHLTHWGRDKWPPFPGIRHFQMHFLEWKCMNFD